MISRELIQDWLLGLSITLLILTAALGLLVH